MYIASLVIPVPEENLDAYREWAKRGAEILTRYGCLEIVESIEDKVPAGRKTDYRSAVAAERNEKIVIVWQIWPDKAFLYAAEQQMKRDNALAFTGEVPFDPSRLIYGCFSPLHTTRRETETPAD